ncbi:unnamed protein product [Fusarium venenatum]|uniref:Uncharacterized protein n=1 Tax=Fusarium venenatum TaxID=56646 RepID=A0A2L2TMM0_9HYPO|nr:uncharacterized protein FVRRES_04931 [Fusarium venenatum]CEI60495.1 unnamed protein product [Fusarium venenatum]
MEKALTLEPSKSPVKRGQSVGQVKCLEDGSNEFRELVGRFLVVKLEPIVGMVGAAGVIVVASVLAWGLRVPLHSSAGNEAEAKLL